MGDATIPEFAASARVARLATVSAEGEPHLVPVCFAVRGAVVYTAVDHKPKRSRRLKRVANLEATRHFCLLVDEYDEEWARLRWARVDGTGRIVGNADERDDALAALMAKYPQYAANPPHGVVLALDVARVVTWAASD